VANTLRQSCAVGGKRLGRFHPAILAQGNYTGSLCINADLRDREKPRIVTY
jgi:hypothetical protein